LKGALVEKIEGKEIYERDGWVCRICGGIVLREEQHPHPLSPTLDHIRPLAKGGNHTRSNLQLAHFICNSYKRDLLPPPHRIIAGT
jgi:5-methylcytosine-specific restriction endonuclease McrA